MIRYKWEKDVWGIVAIMEIYFLVDFLLLN